MVVIGNITNKTCVLSHKIGGENKWLSVVISWIKLTFHRAKIRRKKRDDHWSCHEQHLYRPTPRSITLTHHPTYPQWFYDMNIDTNLLNFGKWIYLRYSTMMNSPMTILNLVMHYMILEWLGVYQSWINELVNLPFADKKA